MAIGGVVITVRPDARRDVEIALGGFLELSVYGSDEKGNIIATIKSVDSEAIEKVIRTIEAMETVSKVNLAYLNTDNASDIAVIKGEE